MPRRDSTDSSSDRSSNYKKRSKKRKRRSSSSSSGDSIKRYHHRSSRSTSSSRSRSRERSRRRHSRSHSVSKERSRRHRSSHSSSRERSYKRRSHSSSRERSRKHHSRSPRKHGSRHSSRSSRHRIRSRSKNKKSRSSSRSDSHSRSSRKSSRKSRSRSHSPHRQKSNSQGTKMREDDVIKLKLQQALKAAATADAELREKGLLAEQTAQKAANNSTLSVADQVKRAQAIEEINAPTFTQQSFTSGTSVKQEKSGDSVGDIHTTAIFGNSTLSVSTNDTSTCINNTTATTKAMREIWKNNPEKLAHETLFEDVAVKTERWKKKLLVLRRRKLNGEHMM